MSKNTLSDVNPDSESKGKDFIENDNKKKDKYDFIHYNLVP